MHHNTKYNVLKTATFTHIYTVDIPMW